VQQQQRAQQEAWRLESEDRAARTAAQQRAVAYAIQLKKEAAEKESRAAAMADRMRDQHYVDQLRDVQVEHERLRVLSESHDQDYADRIRDLQIAKEKTRLAREDEFIDRDLKRQDAETDIVQSHADGMRNVTSGEKSLLEGAGTGLSQSNPTSTLELQTTRRINQQ
jgi:acetoin utilization deacetylase AcuC-like enzyme